MPGVSDNRPAFGRLKRTQEREALHSFDFDGSAFALFVLVLRNLAFTALTLGIYKFWAITHVRRFLWQHSAFQGDRLEWTGTGRELMLGTLLAGLTIVLPLVLLGMLGAVMQQSGQEVAAVALQGLITILFMLLTPMAMYRARRYRLSRTAWRGIRGAQDGSAVVFGLLWLALTLLSLLSLGLALPFRTKVLESYKIENTWFGDRKLSFQGQLGALYRSFLPAWAGAAAGLALLLGPVGLAFVFERDLLLVAYVNALPAGLLLFFSVCLYQAAKFRWLADGVRYGRMGFRCEITTGDMMRLLFGNFLIIVVTLGLGKPFALMRAVDLACGRTVALGDGAFETVAQSRAESSRLAEGLVHALDVDY